MHSLVTTCKDFKHDRRGTIAIIFGLVAMVFFIVIGLAIDTGRAYRAHSKIGAAVDAAALAAAKGLLGSSLTDVEVKALAQRMFDENIKSKGGFDFTINTFSVDVDRDSNAVSISVQAEVPTTLGGLAGFNKFDVPVTSVALFDSKDIELSLSLDMTGSMRGQKTEDLKTATRDLIEILLPDAGTANKVRIGFAPFAASVNAGTYAGPATDYRSPDNCVYERDGAEKTTDAEPAGIDFLKVAGDAGVTTRQNVCPSNARVLPLTDQKSTLLSQVNNFQASGATAGHLGTAWAWYLVSPEWASIWPATATPDPYHNGKTIKAVILMTDGVYNTYGGNYGNGVPRDNSEADAQALCGNMKNKEVIVYSIGFQLNDARATAVLQNCATSPTHFFRAEDGDQLRAAFRDIAVQLNSLRLSK